MERILITGVTGFIGANLVSHFNDTSSYFLVGHSRDVSRAQTIFGAGSVQLIDTYSTKIFNELKIDTVIHLAGIAHDLSNQYKPNDYYRVNFENTKIIFDEFIKSSARKFIFLSSIKAAIDSSSVPIDESVVPHPVTDYGKSKLQAEEYIQSIKIDSSKKAYIFRPCMIHGKGNKGNLNLLYRYAKTGLPYPFGSFANQRSFLSMDNLNHIVQSFLEKDIPSGIFNLSDDGYISTSELYQLISIELGQKPKIWNLSAWLVRILFKMAGKKATLNKLTEDMMVSNEKILRYINLPLPLEIREGLRKTIRSFNGA